GGPNTNPNPHSGWTGDRVRSQWRAAIRRCQRSKVSGVTKNERHPERGSTRLNAASNARSAGRSAGRCTWRRRTPSSWRSTRISTSLASWDRNIQTRSSTRRTTHAYTNDHNTDSTTSPASPATGRRTLPSAKSTREPAGPYPDRVFEPFGQRWNLTLVNPARERLDASAARLKPWWPLKPSP